MTPSQHKVEESRCLLIKTYSKTPVTEVPHLPKLKVESNVVCRRHIKGVLERTSLKHHINVFLFPINTNASFFQKTL